MTKKEETLKAKPVKVCIACREKLEEIEYINTSLVCPNQKCPRFGLLTVVFAQLRKKHESKTNKDENI